MPPIHSIAFYTLGCKVNFSETSYIAGIFDKSSYNVVAFKEKADIYVINTCAVTKAAVKKSKYIIRQALLRNPKAFIVVTGCIAETDIEVLSAIEGINLIVGANEKQKLLTKVEAMLHGSDVQAQNTSDCSEKFFPAYSEGGRTRTFVKIQDGCNYFCSYCIIPFARGRSRSGYISDIVNDVKAIVAKGVKEIVLTGINIGDFKNDKGETLLALLHSLDNIKELKRLRLSSVEPDLLCDDIINLTASSPKLMPHLHLPLQSGSDKILKLMGRKYDTAFFAQKVKSIHSEMPNCCIGTDIITGFPGETESDFEDSLTFVKELPLSYLHVFTYSEREGTKAAHLSQKVATGIAKKRSLRLQALALDKKMAFYESQRGKEHNILFEDANIKGFMYGFTENYVKVKTPYNKSYSNEIITSHLTKIDSDGIFIIDAHALKE